MHVSVWPERRSLHLISILWFPAQIPLISDCFCLSAVWPSAIVRLGPPHTQSLAKRSNMRWQCSRCRRCRHARASFGNDWEVRMHRSHRKLCSLWCDHVYHYIPIYWIIYRCILLTSFMGSHTHSRLTENHTNGEANTTKVLFDCWLFERWRLPLDSLQIKCTNGLAHHQFRTSNNQFIRHLNGKSIFPRRLTLTWLLDGTWTPCRTPIEGDSPICWFAYSSLARSTESPRVRRWLDGWKMQTSFLFHHFW